MIYLLRPHILLIAGQSSQPVEDFIYYVDFPSQLMHVEPFTQY